MSQILDKTIFQVDLYTTLLDSQGSNMMMCIGKKPQ